MAINTNVVIHGGAYIYPERPVISIDLSVWDVTRSGNTISCIITNAAVNGLSGQSYFGYAFTVYAQLDDGPLVELWSKGSSPRQWAAGDYNISEWKSVSSTNLGTTATFKILLNASCTCPDHGDTKTVWQTQVAAPPSNVTVTFELFGGTRTGGGELVQTIPMGGSAIPPTCERTGYNFAGWFGDYTNVTEDRTIGALWDRQSFTVTFNLDGGNRTGGGELVQTVYYGESASPPTCDRVGYRFLGWSGDYTNVTSTRTITATWERLRYTVTFNLDGGTRTGGGAVSQIIYYGENATPPTCERTQCNFVRWDGNYTNVTSDRTILAIWDYIIIYDASELGILLESQIKHKDVDITLLDLILENPGYEFIGWSDVPSYGTSQYPPGGTYRENAPITLYPSWNASQETFTVTFDLRGGTSSGGGALQQTIIYGHDAIPPANVTKQGKRFVGWLGQYTNITSNRTIRAMWDASPLWIFTGESWIPFSS